MKRSHITSPISNLSNKIDSALCVLSTKDTKREAFCLKGSDSKHSKLRDFHGGFGSSQASVKSDTIFATLSPNIIRISFNVF